MKNEKKPSIDELLDKSKTHSLFRKIDASKLAYEEKNFLLDAARRHIIFNDKKITEYFKSSSKEMQELMKLVGLLD